MSTISKRYQFFLFFISFLFIINLMIMNDLTTYWEGAESTLVSLTQGIPEMEAAKGAPLLPGFLMNLSAQLFGSNPFAYRLPSLLCLLFCFLGIYTLGKNIFGGEVTQTLLLVLASSVLTLTLGKIASADVGLLTVQTLSGIALLLYLKKPENLLKIMIWALAFIGALIHPLNMAIWMLGLNGYFYFFHKQGKQLNELYLWVLWPFLIGLLFFANQAIVNTEFFLFKWGFSSLGYYILALMLGMLPWIGFLPAAFWDLFQKWRKGEELAKIMVGWLLVSLICLSPALLFLLALMIAKQVHNYFQKNYPYRNLIKIFCITTLVLVFAALTILMVGGSLQFDETGYQSGVVVSIMYWIPSFIGVLGLFLMDKRVLLAGFVLAGTLLSFFGYLQLGPLIEVYRAAPKRAIQLAKEKWEEEKTTLYLGQLKQGVESSTLGIYAREEFKDIHYLLDGKETINLWNKLTDGIFIVDEFTYNLIKVRAKKDIVAEQFIYYPSIGRLSYPLWVIRKSEN